MARPIEATPVLKGEEARKFLEKMAQSPNRVTHLVATPRLEEARRLARERTAGGQK